MINSKYFTYFSIILLTLVSFMVCFFTFQHILNPKNNTQTIIDKYSGESVSMEAVNDSSVKNPHMPYYVGFDTLKKYGVSSDDYDYITDYLANFIINDKHMSHAKISVIKDTYQQKIGEGIDNNYQFNIAINDASIYTVYVKSNFITNKIILSLSKDNSKINEKSFDINPVYY